jgi:hypothetical protein
LEECALQANTAQLEALQLFLVILVNIALSMLSQQLQDHVKLDIIAQQKVKTSFLLQLLLMEDSYVLKESTALQELLYLWIALLELTL